MEASISRSSLDLEMELRSRFDLEMECRYRRIVNSTDGAGKMAGVDVDDSKYFFISSKILIIYFLYCFVY